MRDAVAEARIRIDSLDGQIIELLRERAAVSKGIQTWRVKRGEPQIDQARELFVYRRLRESLDVDLATAVLRYCRAGTVPKGSA